MKILKTIFKVILTAILFALLFTLFKATGMTIIKMSSVDTSLTFGANIEASFIISSFILALFLAIKSYTNRTYLKWVIIGLLVSLLTLIGSIVTTNMLLKSYEESNSSVDILRN